MLIIAHKTTSHLPLLGSASSHLGLILFFLYGYSEWFRIWYIWMIWLLLTDGFRDKKLAKTSLAFTASHAILFLSLCELCSRTGLRLPYVSCLSTELYSIKLVI